MNIGIWGHYHGGNLGDDVVVGLIIDNLRSRIPDACLYGFSMKPADTAIRHGIPSYPILYGLKKPCLPTHQVVRSAAASPPQKQQRWPAKMWLRAIKVLRTVKKSIGKPVMLYRMWKSARLMDAIIVAGSQVLLDEWSVWAHPYTLFKWALLCKVAHTRLILLSIGAGPLTHPLARFFAKVSLNFSTYSSFRDLSSVAVVETLGIRTPQSVFPDLAFAVDGAAVQPERGHRGSRARPIVGISTMAHNDPRYWPKADSRKYHAYLDTIAGFASWLIGRGYDVSLIKSQTVVDARVAEQLSGILESPDAEVVRHRLQNPDTLAVRELMLQIAQCQIVVGARFHCHVLPLVLGIPVLGIAYHPKTTDLMQYMGLADYSLAIADVTLQRLIEYFLRIERHRKQLSADSLARAAECRSRVMKQFDNVCHTLTTTHQ